MSQLHLGQQVVTATGTGVVTAITAGHADTDIVRYRITHNDRHHWHYLDELVIIETVIPR